MNSSEQRERRPAAECIWYVLVTIAGEPNHLGHIGPMTDQNQYYWNGLMNDRLPTIGGMGMTSTTVADLTGGVCNGIVGLWLGGAVSTATRTG